MSASTIKALTFDTGGTVLDWHRGFRSAFQRAGNRLGIERDWSHLTNELRTRSMKRMLNAGEEHPPTENMDEVHRKVLDELLGEAGLENFDESDRYQVAYEAPHSFSAWAGFPEVQSILRKHYLVASFSILSYRMIMDTSKKNGLSWDAVFSCEGIGKYKLLPEAYLMIAEYLQLNPEECCGRLPPIRPGRGQGRGLQDCLSPSAGGMGSGVFRKHCVFQTKVATDSRRSLPPIPRESCH